jgi:hypothetical protein
MGFSAEAGKFPGRACALSSFSVRPPRRLSRQSTRISIKVWIERIVDSQSFSHVFLQVPWVVHHQPGGAFSPWIELPWRIWGAFGLALRPLKGPTTTQVICRNADHLALRRVYEGRLHGAGMTRRLQIAGPTTGAAVWSWLSPASALLQPRHIRGRTQLPPQEPGHSSAAVPMGARGCLRPPLAGPGLRLAAGPGRARQIEKIRCRFTVHLKRRRRRP